jgi:hypothetical protein
VHRCSAVSRAFSRATEAGRRATAGCQVIGTMKRAANPPLSPELNAEEAQLLAAWGPMLAHFPEKSGQLVTKDDMLRVLNKAGGGWLTNFVLDAYMTSLMPELKAAMPGSERVFLVGAHSHSVGRGVPTDSHPCPHRF